MAMALALLVAFIFGLLFTTLVVGVFLRLLGKEDDYPL